MGIDASQTVAINGVPVAVANMSQPISIWQVNVFWPLAWSAVGAADRAPDLKKEQIEVLGRLAQAHQAKGCPAAS